MAPRELLFRLPFRFLIFGSFCWLSRAFQADDAEIRYMHTGLGTPLLYMEMISFCDLG